MPSDPATIPIHEPTPGKPGLLLSQSESWGYIGLPRTTWFRLRAKDMLPDPVVVPGGALYWRRADLDRWAANLKPDRKPRRRKPR
jgi:predicted DNA-binding transcriptional regulator AlpA